MKKANNIFSVISFCFLKIFYKKVEKNLLFGKEGRIFVLTKKTTMEIIQISIIAYKKSNIWDCKEKVNLFVKTYTDREKWKRQDKAVERLIDTLKKMYYGYKIALINHFPSISDPKRIASAKKAAITRKKNEVIKIEQLNSRTLFPDYFNNTCPKLKLLKSKTQIP